jgi:cytochrome c5
MRSRSAFILIISNFFLVSTATANPDAKVPYAYFTTYCTGCHADLGIEKPSDLQTAPYSTKILSMIQKGGMPQGQEGWDAKMKAKWAADKPLFISSLKTLQDTPLEPTKPESTAPCPTDAVTLKQQVGISAAPFHALMKPILASRFAGRVPHEFKTPATSSEKNACDEGAITNDIRKSYQAEIKPIFETKCFDCHDSKKPEPLYAFDGIGGRLNKVQDDIDDGLAAIDFVADYPFCVSPKGGKQCIAPQVKQPALISAIKSEAQLGAMPLKSFTWIHHGTALTDTEKKSIASWSDESLGKLGCLEKAEAAEGTAQNATKGPAAKVKQLFNRKCLVCHSNPAKDFGVATDLKHLSTTAYIDRTHPEQSKLYQQILSTSKMQMPPGSPLSKDETDQILNWIKAGAPAE